MIQNSDVNPVLLSLVEDAGLNASAPPQQRLLDGWLVRFSPGKAKRARCVNAICAGRLPLADKLALCQHIYDQAGLPMFVRVTPFSQPDDLDRSLEHRGMHRVDDTRVMVAAGLQNLRRESLPSGWALTPVGHEAFAQTVGVLRGSPLAQRQAHGQRLVLAPVAFSGWVLKRDGEVLACAQYAIENGLVGLYDVFTAAPARGQGVARMMCSHLLADAMSHGATTAYLQVEGDNHAARAVYLKLGFRDAYAYHYRTPHPDAA